MATPDLLYAQLTVMNARYAELITGSTEPERWAAAGDQLYLDLDISEANCRRVHACPSAPPSIAISAEAAYGLRQVQRALRVRGPEAWPTPAPAGRLRLRGANAAVVESGVVRTGDIVRRI